MAACQTAGTKAPRFEQNDRIEYHVIGGQAATGQAGLEPVTGPGQSPAERPLAPVQLAGSLALRHSLQVAEHQRQSILTGQSGDLVMQGGQQLIPYRRAGRCHRNGHLSRLSLLHAPPGGRLVRLDGDAVRHLVEPAA